VKKIAIVKDKLLHKLGAMMSGGSGLGLLGGSFGGDSNFDDENIHANN
jgi:hypothetical protein